MACILECVTYHDGTRRMKERTMYGPFESFEKAHEAMGTFVSDKRYEDILIHQLHTYPEITDEHPSAA